MSKWPVVLAVATAASAAVAGTANADTSQAGCQAYGAFVADSVKAFNTGSPGGAGAFVSGVATSGAGAVADTAAFLKQLTCS